MQRLPFQQNKATSGATKGPQISKRQWMHLANKPAIKDSAMARTTLPRWSNEPPNINRNRPQQDTKYNQQKHLNPSSALQRFAKQPVKPSHNNSRPKSQRSLLSQPVKNRPKLRPAPAGQFKHYLSSTQNVFYEQSDEVIQLHRLRIIRKTTLFLLLFLSFTYWVVGRIQPLPAKNCPPNADCLVFPKCRKGYLLQSTQSGYQCVVDPSITKRAQSIGEAAVEQLSQDYGNGDCQSPPVDIAPSLRLRSVLHEFQISDPVLEQQLTEYFDSNAAQEQHQFAFKYSTIYPLQKKHSLQCSLILFSKTHNFRWLIVVSVIVGVLGWHAIKVWTEWCRVKRVYAKLKRWTIQERVIRVQQFKGTIERQEGRWDDQLWRRVDAERCKDGLIVYFVQQEQLYWKEL